MLRLTPQELEDIAERELERRRKISEAHTGRIRSPETSKKIGEGVRRYYANGGVHWRARRRAEAEAAQSA